jgi:hypothetical protein
LVEKKALRVCSGDAPPLLGAKNRQNGCLEACLHDDLLFFQLFSQPRYAPENINSVKKYNKFVA